MILHKSNPFQCILDLSFALELGFVIKHLIHSMETQQEQGYPFWFAKLDVKDGLWCMSVANINIWNFAYVPPLLQKSTKLDKIELVIHSSHQMG